MYLRLPKRKSCGTFTPPSKIGFTVVIQLPSLILEWFNHTNSGFSNCFQFWFAGIGIEEFTEISTQLVEPLEDFFNNVFVMVVSLKLSLFTHTFWSMKGMGLFDLCVTGLVQEEERVRKNRLALLNNIANLPSGIADLSFLPGF